MKLIRRQIDMWNRLKNRIISVTEEIKELEQKSKEQGFATDIDKQKLSKAEVVLSKIERKMNEELVRQSKNPEDFSPLL